MNSRLIVILVLIGAILLAVVAVRARSKPASTAKKFYWVQALKGHPTHQFTQIAFSTRCKEKGIECQIIGPEAWDAVATIAMAKAALARGDVGGMAVWTGGPAFNSFIEEAARQGVPIVLPHFPMDQAGTPGAKGIVTCDYAEAGATAAAEIGRVITEKHGGKGTVAITVGSFNTTENLFAERFTATMKAKYPDVVVLPPQEEGFDNAKAVAIGASILQARPEIVAALSTTGAGPQTWAGAQRNAGRKITVISVNCTRVNVELLKSGEIHALIAQPLWEESAACVDLLEKLNKGETIPWWTKLPAPLVRKEDLPPYEKLLDLVDAALKH